MEKRLVKERKNGQQTSLIAMLRVLPPMFKPVNNLICCKTGLMWRVKRATLLFK